ncbi:hypothetical protein SAMN05216229_12343 [Geopseudomonas sagittaria]|uniref:Uncharacterized protein n=1 Tax=Geopseudomonas sagittaria TaxID=1135990 RepID=A0A1I5YQC6_9GAMM|nr:hypothetical protein [Pseudomonas sagittaria]SFQ46484.1 hypothetical protein SAMN05216229_12343 [Pseudomonas sagittaria]
MSDYFREAFGGQGSPGESIDGGPAFPIKEHLDSYWSGMTLRDYFAAKALAALISSVKERFDLGESYPDNNLRFAKTAYAIADAMLKARGN